MIEFEIFADEKDIHGKHDDGKHDGKYANTKREQEADYQLKEALRDLPPVNPPPPPPKES